MKPFLHLFKAILVLLVFSIAMPCHAQEDQPAKDTTLADTVIKSPFAFSKKALHFITAKYEGINSSVEKQTAKLLERMQRKEARLQKKMHGVDSSKAKQLFDSSQVRYQRLLARVHAASNSLPTPQTLREYIPGLDSMQTSLKFLSGIMPSSISAESVQQCLAQAQQLQGKLQAANEVQQFIRERETYLKQQLQNTPVAKYLKSINKETYYYQQRLAEYKALVNDPGKLGEKLLTIVRQQPAFQKFFQQNSYLSQLFRMPGADASLATASAGLQTRAGVQNILSQRLGAGNASTGMNPEQYLQQQVQTAQSQIDLVKDKLNKLSGGGNSDMKMPDFKPNNQHTKSFFQRLEYGFNIQSQKGTNLLPATSSLALTVGYKFSDNKTAGIGASYNLGLGHGFNHIKLTNEGIGVRSFADIKIKGSFWMSAGYELTYYQAFAKFSDLPNINVWQKSALLGIIKKYSIGKKREGKVQLLYDFLANKEIPRGQP